MGRRMLNERARQLRREARDLNDRPMGPSGKAQRGEAKLMAGCGQIGSQNATLSGYVRA